MSRRPLRRHALSKRDAKSLIRELSSRLPGFEVDRGGIEVADYGDFIVYIAGGEPFLVRLGDVLLPHLKWLIKRGVGGLPHVTVDPGATKAIGRGANNLMVPGVTGVYGSFSEGDVVVVVDERYKTPIAVGVALMSSEELGERLRGERRGRAIRILHRPGDRIWAST